MDIEKRKLIYVLAIFIYATIISATVSSFTTHRFLEKYFNSAKFTDSEAQAMYGKYLDELQEKSREQALAKARSKNDELEMYRQSVITRLNLMDTADRKIYLLNDMQYRLERKKENVNKD